MEIEAGWILRVVLHYLIAGSGDAQNVFYFKANAGGESFSECLDTFIDWAENIWGAAWLDSGSIDADIVQVDVDHVNLAGEVLDNVGTSSVAVTGGLAAEAPPAGAAAFMFASTDRPKSRGRKFVPGFGHSRLTDGEWNGTALTHLLALLLIYLADVDGLTEDRYLPGIVSNPLPENGDPSFLEFQQEGVADATPAYQRRRRPGTGS